METKLVFEYDRVGDILHVTNVAPYAAQETEEIAEDVLARLNPATHEVEGLEILFWSKRLEKGDDVVLPVFAHLRLAVEA